MDLLTISQSGIQCMSKDTFARARTRPKGRTAASQASREQRYLAYK